uniref:EF-hand domain-containing protein n=1 Tax=Trieres chinensis TaxID=1514140 RepID=A0A7S2EDZ4_TRICV|eukprot:CAMPEP_0183298164 /NCGR_PEP_ID=MMETSP0160_2-20130417/5266_1 /TAXON_ID=2839 ORGANISM="Odontella Sinensis, Strain Grunow 1884" /NCGR_SAMPLE_ID=MMETSP0160_2 /ASSEMBLY_ACC=CAM_ASM_000250 /LENGTH=265 /DNA_ID=CAMNT_0025460137 /DNA_START=42 /DNA_END=839 /DNA_ORIENTATION=-
MNTHQESTPLAPSSSAAATTVSSLLTRENAEKAAGYVKDQAEKLSIAAKSGTWSIRALALLGGIGMVTTGALSLFGRIVTLHWVSALINFYVIILGVLVIILEGRKWLPVPKSFEANVRKYALFLDFIWGRGCLYFFIGSLQFSLMNMIDITVGLFMCFVGIAYVWFGMKAAKKLSQLRKSLFSEEELRDKFNAADTRQAGTIDYGQFRVLMRTFGIVLNNTEAESAFLRLDKSGEGQVTFEEFLVWWGNTQFDAEQNSQFAMSV